MVLAYIGIMWLMGLTVVLGVLRESARRERAQRIMRVVGGEN
jgi:hypothetical protein